MTLTTSTIIIIIVISFESKIINIKFMYYEDHIFRHTMYK